MNNRVQTAKENRDTKTVIENIVIAFSVKGGGMLIALFTTSSYITYFSNSAILGVWFTVLSILSWILNFDLGIGNGVRNKLVKEFGKNNVDESKKYISSAYMFLSLIALGILIIGNSLMRYIPWNSILGVSLTVINEVKLLMAIRIVFCSIVIQFVLRLITSISYALQKSFIPGLMTLCTNLLLLIYVVFANYMKKNGDIVELAFVYLFAVNIPLIATTLLLFSSKLKTMRPNLRFFSMSHARETLKLGSVFLYLQIIAMLMNNSANFLISCLLGSEQVVEYQLYYKLFHLISTIVAIGIVPLWSAITKAKIEKRYRWLRRAIYSMFALVGVVVAFEFALVPILPLIFKIWLGLNAIETNYTTGIIFALFGSLFTWQQICSYISNGLGELRIQAVFMTVGVCVSFIFAIIFTKIWNHYLAITVGMILGYIPFCVSQTVWTIKYCKTLNNQ